MSTQSLRFINGLLCADGVPVYGVKEVTIVETIGESSITTTLKIDNDACSSLAYPRANRAKPPEAKPAPENQSVTLGGL